MTRLSNLGSRVLSLFQASLRALAVVAAGLTVVMMISIVASVTRRFVFGKDIMGVLEFNEVLIVGLVFLALARTQQAGIQVKAEFLTSHLSPRLQIMFTILGLVAGIALFGAITWYSGKAAYASVLIGEYRYGVARFPIWPAKLVVPFGSLLLCLQCLLDILRESKKLREFTHKT